MYKWLETKDLKKIQRRVNKIIRELNKDIYDDELWKARFYARQIDRRCVLSDDRSWLHIDFYIEFIDKETNRRYYHWFRKEDFLGSSWRVWEAMNDFIAVRCRVWDKEPRITRMTTIDYRGK